VNSLVWLPLVMGLATTALLTFLLLPFLKRLKGETIREDVPERHRLKAGTPTMGGIAFVISIPLTSFAAATLLQPSLLIDFAFLVGATVSFAFIGLADDLAKLRRKKGWRTQPKLAAQIAMSLFWIAAVKERWALSPPIAISSTIFDLLWFGILLLLFLATVNGVNIADGLDGLASGLTAMASFSIGLLALGNKMVAGAIANFALCGSCLGFLLFNRYPAKVFMGDVGSMALGAGLVMSVFMSKAILPFLLIGIVFWVEQLTVMLQVAYFKWTKRRFGEGRRIFPMTPIHHSFEILGWSEPKIVSLFWLFGAIAATLGILVVLLLSRW